MRPNSIIWFERLYLATLALSLLVSALDWEGTAQGVGTAGAIAIMAVVAIVNVVLVLLVSRRRSRTVKWILAVISFLAAIGLIGYLQAGLESPRDQIDFALILVQVCAIALLFTPSARAWLAAPRQDPRTAEVLERTFE